MSTSNHIVLVRGTTPTITFNFPDGIQILAAKNIWFDINQNGVKILSKELSDGSMVVEGQQFRVTLTQKDTLKLAANVQAFSSIRILLDSNAAANYPLLQIKVGDIIKEGVIGSSLDPFSIDILVRAVQKTKELAVVASLKLQPGAPDWSEIISELREHARSFFEYIPIGKPLYRADVNAYLEKHPIIEHSTLLAPLTDDTMGIDQTYMVPPASRMMFNIDSTVTGYPYPVPAGSEPYLKAVNATPGVQDSVAVASTSSQYDWDINISTGANSPQSVRDKVSAVAQTNVDAIKVNGARIRHVSYVAPSIIISIKPLNGYSFEQQVPLWQHKIFSHINSFHIGQPLFLSDVVSTAMALPGVANCTISAPMNTQVYNETQQVAINDETRIQIQLLSDTSTWPLILTGDYKRALTLAEKHPGINRATVIPNVRGANTADVVVDGDQAAIDSLQALYDSL